MQERAPRLFLRVFAYTEAAQCEVLRYAGEMAEDQRETAAFGAGASTPRARRAARLVMYMLLLALACGAIWWIDRGAMLTNVQSADTRHSP
jgi:hypothetical protein